MKTITLECPKFCNEIVTYVLQRIIIFFSMMCSSVALIFNAKI